ncbi:MAG TPA: DUF5916 domain-containing protein, partial [Candidatus Krumholzibacteria bacterium]|nr:DUF5916 domain-containing protein [Candidatus Krumholzibacteria bacterium]
AAATRTDLRPVIDGVLDDACWENASPCEHFTQVVPVEGAPPTERTVVRVLYDADNLYIAVRCFDSESGKVLARERRRDSSMDGDDNVEVVLDPFADRRNGYYFQLSAGGARTEGLIDASKGEIRLEWDGIWYGKARRDEQGWTGEFAIPFKTIAFNPQAGAWGFNVQRTIRRKQELVRWSSPRTNSQVSRLADAGTLEGIADIKQGLGLTLKPFATSHTQTPDGDTDFKPGLDIFYRLTPSTTAAITTNTDFAETEVDARVVNLTRFPIFFPEKRAFFLQDATVFSFGGIFQSPIPFYSRRIGVVGGVPKDILAGARVTGREGPVNFGFMDVQMKDDPALGSKNLSVGRVAFNVLHESTAGLIFTHGDPGSTGDNTLAGGDFNYRTSSVFGDQVLETHAWLMGSFSSRGPEVEDVPGGVDGNDLGFGGRISYPNDTWSGGMFAARYGPRFHPALGFIQRPGTYEIDANFNRRWRPRAFIRRVDLGANQSIFLDLDGNMQTRQGGLPTFVLEDQYGDVFSAEYDDNRDVLTDPFEIHEGVVIPTGDYRFGRASTTLQIAAARSLSPAFSFATGDYYTGTRTDYVGQLDWRPGGWLFASAYYEYDDVNLPEGAFIVRVMSARGDILFSPEFSWSTIAQYDSESKNLGFNSRVRWEVEPGQEVFFVVNKSYLREDGHLTNASGNVALKIGLTFRF